MAFDDDDDLDLPAPLSGEPWSVGRRVTFRFVFAYAFLFVFPFPLDLIPGIEAVTGLPERGWNALVVWLGHHVFHLPVSLEMTGSGDTLASWLRFGATVVLAVIATIAWSALDRRAWNHVRARELLRTGVRFYLAMAMAGYGFAKVFVTQFVPPDAERLAQPLGEFSPMGLLWSFMGASVPYVIFTGVVECVAGFFLLWRRTSTLGALIAAGAMTNVFVLNLCYDVPVKLYSAHLLAAALYVASEDAGRLFDVLVLRESPRPAPPPEPLLPDSVARLRQLALPVKLLIVAYMGYTMIHQQREMRAQLTRMTSEPLEGVWRIAEDAPTSAPASPPTSMPASQPTSVPVAASQPTSLPTSRPVSFAAFSPAAAPEHWHRLVIGSAGYGKVRLRDDEVVYVALKREADTLTLTTQAGVLGSFTVRQPEPDTLELDGQLGATPVHLRLRRTPRSANLLVSRGFHWVNEFPYNR